MEHKEWWQQKTTWTALLLVVTVLIPIFWKDATPEAIEGIRAVIVGLALIFARAAIENTKPT